jgi:putative N6-adenine-specific DNA methylase
MMRGAQELFAVSAPGLGPALRAECEALGWHPRVEPGGVAFAFEAARLAEANLRLRTASRVWLRVARFPAPDAEALCRGLEDADPRQACGDVPFALTGAVEGSRLGRVDRLIEAAERTWRIRSAESETAQTVLLRIEDDVCTVAVDTSGELLYRRGYRQEISRAPLRETLGAGLLLLAGYDGTQALWDPMCGSGTLVIEGALLALRRAPGLNRGFAFERWPGVAAEEVRAIRERVSQERLAAPPAPIWGTDLHAGSLGTARRNARRAEVLDALRLERQDATKLTLAPPAEAGLLISNLPYGIRVGEKRELEALYRGLSQTLRERFQGWRAALYVAKDSPTHALGLEVEQRFEISNGGIRCELIVGSPSGRPRAPVSRSRSPA